MKPNKIEQTLLLACDVLNKSLNGVPVDGNSLSTAIMMTQNLWSTVYYDIQKKNLFPADESEKWEDQIIDPNDQNKRS